MPGVTRIFRVPCRCSATVPVGLGQAGTEVRCPACGAIVRVPRLRDLSALEQVKDEGAERVWHPGHAWLFVGCAVAAVAGISAGLLSQFDGGASQRLPDEAVIRTAIDSADVVTVYKAWLAVKQSGVDRGAIADEVLVQQVARSVGGIAMLLWCVAAVGVMITIVTGMSCFWPQPRIGKPAR